MSFRVRTTAVLMMLLTGVSNGYAQAVAAGKNEVETDFSFSTATYSGIDSNRTTDYSLRFAYGRFLTDRFAIGPLFTIRRDLDNLVTPINLGGVARYYFVNGDALAIPFVEGSSSRTINEAFEMDHYDVQASAGLVFPIGESGGRFRVAPYYRRAFYDRLINGYSYQHSFGVSWSVGLLF